MAVSRNLSNKPKARPIKSSLPPSYAAIFDECVEYAYRKVVGNDPDDRLISRKTEYMFVQRSVMEYMNAIVIDARENNVIIGAIALNAENSDP